MRLVLEPLRGALAGEVPRVEPLAHDPLEVLLLGGAQQRLSVVERLGEAHRPVPPVEQLPQTGSAFREREVDHRLAVHLEQVEHVVDDRRAGLCLLHRGEARAPVLVERADLAVDHAVGGPERLGELPRDLVEALCVVLILAGAELSLAAGDPGDDAVAVPLDLVLPAVAARHLVRLRESREHRRVPALRASRRGSLLSLADEQPVLLVAAELRRDEAPDPVELLSLEPHRETAVRLLLEDLVGARVPDLDRACAVLALRDLAFEGRVAERVVLDVDREVLQAGLERDALRDGPAREHAVALEPEVVVEPPRVVALHDEQRFLASLAARAERLRSLLRIALAAVLAELRLGHGYPSSARSHSSSTCARRDLPAARLRFCASTSCNAYR